ncbi:hypothetical protein BC835DRAFT_667746 [Cytidiella melzeri]|nr:hypothetical protein BC835DRAFT_667746 [Cytidiella melzeri]
MSSDNRYYNQQDPNPPYAYAPYPPYDATQYPPSSARPMRNGASHPHPPPQQQQQQQPPPPPPQQQYPGHPPPNTYPPPQPQQAYPPPYGVPHPQQSQTAQWTPEGWQQHYPSQPQSYPPPMQQQEPPYGSRSDSQQAQRPGDTRALSAGPSKSDNRRADERADRPPDATSQSSKGRKGKEPLVEPPQTSAPLPQAPQLGLDYHKLIESYRLIIDSSNAIGADTGAGRQHGGYAETLERMLQAATYGAQALDSATKRSACDMAPRPPQPPPPLLTNGERSHEEGDGKSRKPNVNVSD